MRQVLLLDSDSPEELGGAPVDRPESQIVVVESNLKAD